MENPVAEDISVSYDKDHREPWFIPAGGYVQLEKDARAVMDGALAGYLFREAEEAYDAPSLSPCGIHLFTKARHTCPICALERARIRAGVYDRPKVTDSEDSEA